jgi:hypothetical protein
MYIFVSYIARGVILEIRRVHVRFKGREKYFSHNKGPWIWAIFIFISKALNCDLAQKKYFPQNFFWQKYISQHLSLLICDLKIYGPGFIAVGT